MAHRLLVVADYANEILFLCQAPRVVMNILLFAAYLIQGGRVKQQALCCDDSDKKHQRRFNLLPEIHLNDITAANLNVDFSLRCDGCQQNRKNRLTTLSLLVK